VLLDGALGHVRAPPGSSSAASLAFGYCRAQAT
jgi:hypothetical protein